MPIMRGRKAEADLPDAGGSRTLFERISQTVDGARLWGKGFDSQSLTKVPESPRFLPRPLGSSLVVEK